MTPRLAALLGQMKLDVDAGEVDMTVREVLRLIRNGRRAARRLDFLPIMRHPDDVEVDFAGWLSVVQVLAQGVAPAGQSPWWVAAYHRNLSPLQALLLAQEQRDAAYPAVDAQH